MRDGYRKKGARIQAQPLFMDQKYEILPERIDQSGQA
jgi:hypothetical protein